MKRMIIAVIFLVVVLMVPMLVASSGMKAEGEKAAMESSSEMIDMEAAKTTFETTCSKCHATSRPLGKKKDQAGWEKTVARMSSYHKNKKGKAIAEEDQKAIVQYLVSVAGK